MPSYVDVKLKLIDTDSKMVVEEGGELAKGKGGQMYGDGRWFDLGGVGSQWNIQTWVIEMHTWNLCDPTDQCHPQYI